MTIFIILSINENRMKIFIDKPYFSVRAMFKWGKMKNDLI